MEVIIDRCAGLDVHKRTVVACVRTPGTGRQKRASEVATFGTFQHQLEALNVTRFVGHLITRETV